MRSRMIFWLVLLCASFSLRSAVAEHVLVITKAGYFVLEQDSMGNPTLHKVERVLKLDEAPEPPPDPTLTERAKAIRDKVRTVQAPARDQTAQLMAETYREIAKLVGTSIKGQIQVSLALKMANDKILEKQGGAQAWQPVRDLLSSQLTAAAQEGASDADYAKLVGEVADGLDASVQPLADGQKAKLNPDMIKFIIELIKLIIEFLNRPTP